MTYAAIVPVGMFGNSDRRRERAAAIQNSPPELATVALNLRTTDILLGRVGRADRDAFSELYDVVAPMVYGAAPTPDKDGRGFSRFRQAGAAKCPEPFKDLRLPWTLWSQRFL